MRCFWELSDYGMSTPRILAVFPFSAIGFALLYYLWGLLAPPGIVENLFKVAGMAVPFYVVPIRALYFSVVTMTTLGFDDLHANPASVWGHVFLAVQVILGYVILGALITRLREDVGDPRVKVLLDPTNMLNPSVYYRTTELLNECFSLLGENILYAHAKDVLWTPDMLPSLKWVVPGMGTMDYEVYLTHLSRLKNPRPLLLEFLPAEQYPQAKKFIEETAARIGVKIHR